jgi:hypothetical protein
LNGLNDQPVDGVLNCLGDGHPGIGNLLDEFNPQGEQNFCTYLQNHRHRIVNYDYYQAESFCSMASEAVESKAKQIDRRLKISGSATRSYMRSGMVNHLRSLSFRSPLGQYSFILVISLFLRD